MGNPTETTASRKATDCPTAWFAVLERAINTGNLELAAKAQRQLRRLGVTVEFSGRGLMGAGA